MRRSLYQIKFSDFDPFERLIFDSSAFQLSFCKPKMKQLNAILCLRTDLANCSGQQSQVGAYYNEETQTYGIPPPMKNLISLRFFDQKHKRKISPNGIAFRPKTGTAPNSPKGEPNCQSNPSKLAHLPPLTVIGQGISP